MAEEQMAEEQTPTNPPAGNQPGSNPPANSPPAGTPPGSASPGWLDSLPDDLKGHEALSTYKDKTPADVAKALIETSGKLKTALVAPGESATPEEKQAFNDSVRKMLGVPEKPEGYQLKLPEGITDKDPLLAAIVKDGHAKGMTTEQLQGAIDTFAATMSSFRSQQQAEGKKALETLWGAQFKENLDAALRGMNGLAKDAGVDPKEIKQLMNETGWGDNPVLARMFALAGKNYKEDSLKGSQGGGGSTPKSAAEVLYGSK